MTMLTPLGAGGSSRRGRRGRRWPKVLIALIVIAVIAVGAYLLVRWLQRDDQSEAAPPTPTAVCRTPTLASPKALPQPDAVTVAVANGTEQSGLAVRTADQLAARGFTVSDIGNTAEPVKKGVALVRYAPSNLADAITAASYLPGADLVEVQKGSGAAVSVWLGPAFERVATKAQADATTVDLPTQEPRCHTRQS
jgi:hypothetical protein